MRGRILLFVLLASALTFLASLFMPWRERALGITIGQGPFTPSQGGQFDGWVTGTGDPAVARNSPPGYPSGASASRQATSPSPWCSRCTP
jgi:hypothetical protein